MPLQAFDDEKLTDEERAKVLGNKARMLEYIDALYAYGVVPTYEAKSILIRNLDDVFQERWGSRL